MQRREFVQRSAQVAGAAAIYGLTPKIQSVEEAATKSLPPDAPAPISEEERIQRREKAQRLMKQLGFSAMLIEPGANMIYFTGIEWGRSERLFAFLLPDSGKPIVISPAFEQQRAEDQVNGRFDIRVWQEDQNPELLVADTIKDLGLATGRLAIDPSARVFVFTELAQARPGMQFGSAAIVTNQFRGVKSAYEIEIMRYANQITLQAYRGRNEKTRRRWRSIRVVRTIVGLSARIAEAARARGESGRPRRRRIERARLPVGHDAHRRLRHAVTRSAEGI